MLIIISNNDRNGLFRLGSCYLSWCYFVLFLLDFSSCLSLFVCSIPLYIANAFKGWFHFVLYSCVYSGSSTLTLFATLFSQVHYTCSLGSGILACRAVPKGSLTCHSAGHFHNQLANLTVTAREGLFGHTSTAFKRRKNSRHGPCNNHCPGKLAYDSSFQYSFTSTEYHCLPCS